VSTPDAWSDLFLTLPMFVGYHLGVIFLPVRNAADVVTRELVALADHNMAAYGLLTVAIGGTYAVLLVLAGRGHALKWHRFLWMAGEGILYAIAMRLVANYVVGRVFLAEGVPQGAFAGLVMSLGAGFYEELAFRVILFGAGLKVIALFYPPSTTLRRLFVPAFWALATAAVFSGWHYVGALGDTFESQSFLFRWVCGGVFVAIYALRGFAPAVWTHTVYDVWAMVL
jgi:CAAX prenyl protease-like protein